MPGEQDNDRLDKTLLKRVRKHVLVPPGEPANVLGRDTSWEDPKFGAGDVDDAAASARDRAVQELAKQQSTLWASHNRAVLVVLQSMDAGGKDSTIKRVLSGINPQGVRVTSFKQPNREELEHDFLWRVQEALPERGVIGVYNRSHYEDVIVVRVHPEWLDQQHVSTEARGPKLWKKRFEDINAWEHHLDREGTKIVKLFLHISRDEQRKRFLARLDRPDKRWKFNAHDMLDRQLWDEYMEAYEAAITATSTKWAPWHIIPADSKPVLHATVACVLLDAMRSLDLKAPEPASDELAAMEEARRVLLAEHKD